MMDCQTLGRNLRSWLAIDEREAVVRFAQSPAGKIAIFAFVLALLCLPQVVKRLDPPWWVACTLIGLALHAYLPRFRGPVLFAFTWGIAALSLPASPMLYASLGVFFVLSWCTIIYARRCPGHLVPRRPVVTLLAIQLGLACVASILPGGGITDSIWAFLLVSVGGYWFLAYAIVDQRSRDRSPDLVQMGVVHPFWVTSTTPIGKGAAFLRRHLSRTSHDLAVTQIKGVKLLLWAVVLLATNAALYWVVILKFGIPTTHEALAAFLEGRPYPVLVGWSAVIFSTVHTSLAVAVWGHKIIGLARLAGFRLPRNMCRPLESRTLAEFWNRFYFYFKELLVDFFYIPAFLSAFKKSPRLRILFSTLMAAGVGNAVFHFVRDIGLVQTMGVRDAIVSFNSYLFYSTVLGAGIAISQMRRASGFVPGSTLLARIWSFVCVWSFVVCLNIFGDESRVHTLFERLAFMASLFGAS